VAYVSPEALGPEHRIDDFDCGEPPLDEWLKQHALTAQASRSARIFVTVVEGDADKTVVGYYALAAAQVEPSEATMRAMQGQPKLRPVPAILLARLAVDIAHQGVGVGKSLLRDAMLRCRDVAEEVGVRVLLIHAKHEEAKRWYLKFDFEESPTDPLHLMMLLKDLRAAVGS
jgi:GNAT superfamily N-acetyltransferase